jgi:hypothetical protein
MEKIVIELTKEELETILKSLRFSSQYLSLIPFTSHSSSLKLEIDLLIKDLSHETSKV